MPAVYTFSEARQRRAFLCKNWATNLLALKQAFLSAFLLLLR
jgi:hypothetical protein